MRLLAPTFSLTTADATMTFRNGLQSLLRPEDSVLVLIDDQPYQHTTTLSKRSRRPLWDTPTGSRPNL